MTSHIDVAQSVANQIAFNFKMSSLIVAGLILVCVFVFIAFLVGRKGINEKRHVLYLLRCLIV